MSNRRAQTILGPILNPRADGSIDFIPDGALACDDDGIITYVGARATAPPPPASPRNAQGIILPPFLDAHIHIPQHPIRGHFMDGVGAHPDGGRLIAGLNKNVFPAEAKCTGMEAFPIVADFERDTLAKGVVGGAAYMNVDLIATQAALQMLGEFWHVGLVLMEMNCPAYLRTDGRADGYMRTLGEAHGRRFIVTDRFAVAVGSETRRRAADIARQFGLRMQTHLNEQLGEKELVEQTLYPDAASYTDVYARDGLLDRSPILAHCVHNAPAELDVIARSGSVVAHCPTSNALLASGIMPLDEIASRGIEYAICTDVGASPTTSMLAEMAQFLKVHAGRSSRATPQEALYRATLGPAKMLGIDDRVGSFAIGRPASFIDVAAGGGNYASADEAILRGLLGLSAPALDDAARRRALDELQGGRLDAGAALELLERDVRETARRLDAKVMSVTMAGAEVYRRRGGESAV